MKLYNFAWGPYPRRLTHYLAEKGITDVQLIEVEFPHRHELWPPGFLLDLNPAHSLPVLETEEGLWIGQSIAILEYLEERYPEPNLLGVTAGEHARTRELVAILDEATAFFGLWARQGSQVNAGRHPMSTDAARIGANRFADKLRVAERMVVGPLLLGSSPTIADCVGMALLEFTDQFYGVSLPSDCPALSTWYANFSQRPGVEHPPYPAEMLRVARGLPEQSRCFI